MEALAVDLFIFGEFLTSMIWAKVNDCLGREPTLIIGVLGASISTRAFGQSANPWMALGARAFGELVNPNVGVVSACVRGLIKKREHQVCLELMYECNGVDNSLPENRQSIFNCPIFARRGIG
jgi:hypothetical protein